MPSPTACRSSRSSGQATIELVALLPLLAVVCGALWQAVVAGQALWLAGGAARAGARAAAIGADPALAARGALPRSLARTTGVETRGDGDVVVRVRVPLVLGGGHVATVTARAALPLQR